jgi:hypothetical protein
MSSLSDFVNEQRNKSSITGRSYFNVAQIGSKMTTSFSGFFKPINSSSTDDAELLTAENGSVCDGQLPSTRNRFLENKNNFLSDDK